MVRLCAASLSTTVTRRQPPPPGEPPPLLSVLLVLACFCVYLHVLWLFYSIEKKKKPAATVVEYQSLWLL